MDIKQLARKPKLVEVTLDNEEIVKAYGDEIKFWMYDFVDINTYFDFFKSQSEGDNQQLNAMMRSIILDKAGKPALAHDEALPIDIAVLALQKINETLGKSNPKSLTETVGNHQE